MLIQFANRQQNLVIEVEAERGSILDRNGKEFATNLKVPSIYVVPRLIPDKDRVEIAKELSQILNLDEAFIKDRINRDKSFVWLKRRTSIKEADEIQKLKKGYLGITYGPKRFYPHGEMLSNVLGFSNIDTVGVEGLELLYNQKLSGRNGFRYTKRDALGREMIAFEEKTIPAVNGARLILTIDQHIQYLTEQALDEAYLKNHAESAIAVVMNPKTGEILAIASVPEFNPNILSKSADKSDVSKLTNDPKKPFFNRTVSGLYPPGSIAKIAVAAGALNENLIDPKKQILSTGSITLPNPFNPELPDIFPDWKAHGWVDMVKALSVSSNVYFYTIGGGYEDQKGLGVSGIERYLKLFGFGEKTGIDLVGEKEGSLPDPTKKQGGRTWSIGDTYHLAIGQGDLQVTPIQMAVYTAAIASKGTIFYPHIVKAVLDKNKKIVERFSYAPQKTAILREDIFNILHEGMREAVHSGTASGLSGLPISIAAKTGTAEIGDTGRVNSWSIGFLPYDNPKIAFTILMENGARTNTIGATFVASEMIRWMADTQFLQTLDE